MPARPQYSLVQDSSMVQMAVLALLLAAILSLLASAPKRFLKETLQRSPAGIWAAPLVLSAAFSGAATLAGAWSLPLALLALAYTAVPLLCASAHPACPAPPPPPTTYLTA